MLTIITKNPNNNFVCKQTVEDFHHCLTGPILPRRRLQLELPSGAQAPRYPQMGARREGRGAAPNALLGLSAEPCAVPGLLSALSRPVSKAPRPAPAGAAGMSRAPLMLAAGDITAA